MKLGIYGVSSQSGKAYLADFLKMGYEVIGYGRKCEPDIFEIDAIKTQGGIYLERPENNIEETNQFLKLQNSVVTTDLSVLVKNATIIFITIPSTLHFEAVAKLKDAGILKKMTPLVLSPSRTAASPYIWRILGKDYPIISFITCPYSCKTFKHGVTYIKNRKRSWLASIENKVHEEIIAALSEIYPQMLLNDVPATTSLGNIGAIFHPATYLLNWDGIKAAENNNERYPFYVEGIVNNKSVAEVIGQIDQVRLRIANQIGLSVYGLESNPREKEWHAITSNISKEEYDRNTYQRLRANRAKTLQPLRDCVVSAQHWLDYTYDTTRIPGESIGGAIRRTKNFNVNSFPQERYIHEDVPTGLVPMESLAKRLNINCEPITEIIELYKLKTNIDARKTGRTLEEFEFDYLIKYLCGGTMIVGAYD